MAKENKFDAANQEGRVRYNLCGFCYMSSTGVHRTHTVLLGARVVN